MRACRTAFEAGKTSVKLYFMSSLPTETEEAFNNTCKLVDEAGIDKLHVFPYSERKGTPAALMPQVDMEERRRRAKILRSLREDGND